MAEIAALKKEAARLKAERDILKKRPPSSRAKRHDVRLRFTKHHRIWPVSWLCEVLGVSRSGFHAWLNRPTSARAIHDAKLVTAIGTSFKASDRTYGARRVWRDVLEEGLSCGLHRIERLMRGMPCGRGQTPWEAEGRRANGRSLPTTSSTATSRRAAEPEVDRRLHLHLDRRGLALRCRRHRPVLAARGRLVDEGRRMTALVTDALVMAIWRRGKPDALLHHSDQAANTPASSSSG